MKKEICDVSDEFCLRVKMSKPKRKQVNNACKQNVFCFKGPSGNTTHKCFSYESAEDGYKDIPVNGCAEFRQVGEDEAEFSACVCSKDLCNGSKNYAQNILNLFVVSLIVIAV